MIKIAIMQPYFLPYIGYFQLMGAVDRFVLYDDVAFITRGWINRNRLLIQGAPWRFTLPLANASQNLTIREIRVADSILNWRRDFFKTLHHAYGKAPYYTETLELIQECLQCSSTFLIDWLQHALSRLSFALELRTELTRNSEAETPPGLKGQERILAICSREGACIYRNAFNGQSLYDPLVFAERGLTLQFMQARIAPYPQFGAPFVPCLSIVDILMFNGRAGTISHLNNYDLIE